MSDAEGTQQRLAAILAADGAGYSRLMAHDERATVAALHGARKAFRDAIRARGGRVIDMAGDSVLAIFQTAAGALNAAIDVQQQLESMAAGIPADRRMRFRIGVHLGDILENPDGSVYGQGVNIAARLESLALPGGITVSDAVRGSVRDSVAGVYEDLGDQLVKNIADPVRVYRLVPKGAKAARDHLPSSTAPSRTRHWTWVLPGAALAVGAVLAAVYLAGGDQQDVTDGAPLLSLAVLPFSSSDKSEPDLAVDSFTREVSSGLAQTVLGRAVVSADAASFYQGALADPRKAGSGLNVRYVVTGDIRRENYQLFVSARLIDGQTGLQKWATQFHTTRHDSTDVAAQRLQNGVLAALYKAELDRLPSRPSKSSSPLELVLRAEHQRTLGSERDNLKATEDLCDRALRIDPTMPAALWCKADVIHRMIVSTDPSDSSNLDKRIAGMEAMTRQVVQLDPTFARFWNTRADALRWQHNWKAQAEARGMASRLAPALAETQRAMAWDFIFRGEVRMALFFLATEAEVNPDSLDDKNHLHAKCRIQVLRGEYDKAIAECEKAANRGGSEDFVTPMFLAAAYAQQGDTARAQAMRDRAVAALPGLTVARWKAECAKYSDQPLYWQIQERYLLPGLRKAGLPEN